MLRFSHLLSGCALAVGTVAGAQSPYPQPGYAIPFAPQSDADQLAQQMRLVAANPTDLYALIAAARLSLKVGDTDAAAALYTRADRINPQQPQVKAGMARLLVQAGRPGEALRRFQEAERLGASLADFGPDRALAYDLIGEQPRAQREYRALLRLGADDETTRRYALSLGIAGLKEPALALLEPLNRRGDRGAWRARAFVLAMTGDRPGAERIANTMMPPGMGQGLDPFFDRLPRLDPSERAFAVNFGETRASPARTADARLAPLLPALSPEPDPFPKAHAPVPVAAVRDDGRKKKRKAKQDRPEPVRFAATQPYVAPLPPPPAPTAAQLASLNAVRTAPGSFMPAPAQGVRVLPPPPEAYRGPVVQIAPASAGSDDEPDFAVSAVSALAAGKAPAVAPTSAATPAPPPAAVAASTAAPRSFFGVPDAQTSNFTLAGSVTTPATTAAVSPAVASPVATALNGVAASMPAEPVAVAAKDVPPPAEAAAAPPPAAVAAITPATGAPPAPVGARGDSVLAAIVAGITIPDAERDPAPAAPTAAPPPPRLLANVEKKAETERVRAAAKPAPAEENDRTLPRKDARGRFVDAKGKPLLDARGRPLGPKAAAAWQLAQADPKQADKPDRAEKPDSKLPAKDARGRFVDGKGKPLLDARGRPLDAKAAAAWKAAQGRELTDAKKKPESARGEPQRYWVQVAGGADEAGLGKAWRAVSGRAPSLRGKTGWTTPLRATNRVLTGPFASSAEAMAMVNQLKKEGVSAFMFTSDAGQKVARLGAN